MSDDTHEKTETKPKYTGLDVYDGNTGDFVPVFQEEGESVEQALARTKKALNLHK